VFGHLGNCNAKNGAGGSSSLKRFDSRRP